MKISGSPIAIALLASSALACGGAHFQFIDDPAQTGAVDGGDLADAGAQGDSSPDVGPAGDAGDAGQRPETFACGSATCTAPAQYCFMTSTGAHCRETPSGCGTTPTCACIERDGQCATPTCTAQGDEITITCAL